MAINDDVLVEIDGGKVFVDSPMNLWVKFKDIDKKNVMELAEISIPTIVRVEGLKLKDGSDATVQDFKEMKFSYTFFQEFFVKWAKAIQGNSSEASAKNE
ncbi:MAG: hypothetical protein E6R03_09695 [Hyphomicrobiaceae bacterium]|nr:MAG: hypothetical protein E6R03_09695 [Hyphomicrobiaceae bacterium]